MNYFADGMLTGSVLVLSVCAVYICEHLKKIAEELRRMNEGHGKGQKK